MLVNIVRMNVFSVCCVALWANVVISIRGQHGNNSTTQGEILARYSLHLERLRNKSFTERCSRSSHLTTSAKSHCDRQYSNNCDFYFYGSDCAERESTCHEDVKRQRAKCIETIITTQIYDCQNRASNYSHLRVVQNGSSCSGGEFSCRDGPACVFSEGICDGINHCLDRSDEGKASMAEGRWCPRIASKRRCFLPQEIVCRGWNLCEGKIDNCLCETNTKYFLDEDCFRCISKPTDVLPISKLCDGVFDCLDFSDECICSSKIRPTVCNRLRWESYGLYLMCNSSNNEAKIKGSKVCDERVDCENGEDEIDCTREGMESSKTRRRIKGNFNCHDLSGITDARGCDGVAECNSFWYEECECPHRPNYCSGADALSLDRPLCDTVNASQLKPHICDGRRDCKRSGDEKDCIHRFYCTNEPLPNIPIEKRCDKQEDCENGADERNCPHFSCNDAGSVKFISRYAVCDGIKDCEAGSDECQDGCINSVFSDEKSMINIKFILALVWIISVLAIIGCVSVITKILLELMKPKTRKHGFKTSRRTKAIKMLILSLSVSDLMVTGYALAICIKALKFSQDYCLEDRAWRSSSTCSALGAISLIGSEQTMFTMILIAVERLNAVMRPFSQPNTRAVTVAILVCWVISIVLGTIPLLSQYEDYFITSITFTPNKIFKEMRHNETLYMINWLSQRHNGSIRENNYGTSDWNKIKNLVKKINPNITAEYEFGYYSSHTVCLPTFFPDQARDKSWGYTLLLLTINFIAFLFMLVAYILLYRHASNHKAVEKSSALHKKRMKQNAKMQRKLTRIVITDFLCWIPLCIMGYLRLGGVDIPKDAYLPAGLIIVPLNSALNPFLYSDLPEMIMNKLKLVGRSLCPAKVIQQEREVIEMKVRAHHLPGLRDQKLEIVAACKPNSVIRKYNSV